MAKPNLQDSSLSVPRDRALRLLLMLADFIFNHSSMEQDNDAVVDELAQLRVLAEELRQRRSPGEKPARDRNPEFDDGS